MYFSTKKKLATLASTLVILLLSGCHHNNSTPVTVIEPPPPVPVIYSYEVKVVNLTTAQPMSPIAVILHNKGKLWEIGQSASNALEMLAESGDNSVILADPMVLSGKSGAGVLLPGASETINISLTDMQPMMLSLATMLVNTNDAFTGVNMLQLKEIAMGESVTLMTNTYDAGTEKNSELMATIPGPVAGGEGYNAERDDIDLVTMHAGVVSKDDGLSQSVLNAANRFDNPTLMVTITRTM